MNKKVIGIIVAVVIILAAIIGVVFLVNNDSLNKENINNDNSKALGTTIQSEKNEQNEQAILNENNVRNILIFCTRIRKTNYNFIVIDL